MAEKKIIVPEKKLITNASLADRAVAFISALKHTKGEWRRQECTVRSLEECKRIYGLDKCEHRILEIEELKK